MFLSMKTVRIMAELGDVWAQGYARLRRDLPDTHNAVPAKVASYFGPLPNPLTGK